MKKLLGLLLSVVLLQGTVNADSYVFNANMENWGTSSGNVFVHTFALPDVATIDSVSIELSHSWASDIEFGLYSPTDDQSTAADLDDVPAKASYNLTSDLGGSNDFGNGGSLLSDVATYVFWDPVNGFGDVSTGGNPIAPGNYDAISWGPGGDAAGMWALVLTDDAGGDDGAVGTVIVNYTPSAIPEPTGALLLVGLGGLTLFRRRR